MIVPCTTEPFFSSIVTVSLFNFIKNLNCLNQSQSWKVLRLEVGDLWAVNDCRRISKTMDLCQEWASERSPY